MKVTFQIEGGSPVVIECNAGENLLELARRANVAIDAPCSGNGSCGKCRVKLVEGTVESPKTLHISEEEFADGWRLSCSSRVIEDVTVLVPDIASAYQSRMKTADLSSPEEIAIFTQAQEAMRSSGIVFENKYRALDLVMDVPSLEDTMPDNERLTWAIQAAAGVEKVEIPYAVMVRLAHVLRENNFHVCVKGELDGDSFRCMEITSPTDAAIVGCAIDIGTTTVSMVLTDLTSGKLLPLSEETLKERKEEAGKDREDLTAVEFRDRYYALADRFAVLDIPMLIDRSADEKDVLAQADWLRLYGILLGNEDQADNMIKEITAQEEKNA